MEENKVWNVKPIWLREFSKAESKVERKYEFTGKTKILKSCGRRVILHRIRALKDIVICGVTHVKKGALGGWIEKEENLSHQYSCWVYDEAMVYDNAHVIMNAKIYGAAKIYGKAIVSGNVFVGDTSQIFGNAYLSQNVGVYNACKIYDNAKIYDDAKISGSAYIFGNAIIQDKSQIFGNLHIFGDSVISGSTIINNNAYIKTNRDYISVGPLGSRHSVTTFYKDKRGMIYVCTGCFAGNINEFIKAVKERHKNNEVYRTEYLDTVWYANKILS